MPLFELEAPDGAKYEVEAPDEHSAVAAFKKMTAQQTAKPRGGLFDDLIPSGTTHAPRSSQPIQIQAPDGSLVEFPDGTDDETTKGVMRKNFGGPAPQPKKPGLFDDLIPQETNQASGAGLFDDLIPQSRSQAYTDAAGELSTLTQDLNASPAVEDKDALYVLQRGNRGIADFLGGPVDLAAAGVNIGALGADKLASIFGASVPYRVEKPFMGSDWIADRTSAANEALGGETVSPDEVSGVARVLGEATRFGTGAVLGGGLLASGPVQMATQGRGRVADILRGYTAPYRDSPRAMIGDAAAGAGAGATMTGYEDFVPEDVQEKLGPVGPAAAAMLGGMGGATGHAIVSGAKDATINLGRNVILGKSDPAAPMSESTGRPYSRSEMDEAARSVQAQASNPTAAAARIRESAEGLRSVSGEASLPTTGALSGDAGLALLEREARSREPRPFIERDRAVNSRAADLVTSTSPAEAVSRDFTESANQLQHSREQAARGNLETARQAEQGHAEQLRNLGAPVAAAVGQKVPASQNLDALVVGESLVPMQARKNEAFAAVDPNRSVVRDARPLVQSAQAIRDGLGRLNDPGSVLPTRTLDRIAALAPDAGGNGTITFGELNALRPELSAGLAKARASGDFALADNIQALQRALNRETDTLAREASPAGQRAAEAQRVYNDEFAPIWNVGPGDEATRFRRDVNADRAARTQSPPSTTAGRFLRAGQPEKVDALRRIMTSMPDQAAAAAEVRRYLVADLAESGVIDATSGHLRPDALRRWRSQWGNSLDVAPGFGAEVDDLLRRTDDGALRLGQLARDVRSAEMKLDDVTKNRGALGLVLGKDPVNAVSSIFRSGDPENSMKGVLREIGSNSRAKDGLKASVVDYMMQRVSTPAVQKTVDAARPVSFDKLENLFNEHENTLASVFSPEEMNTLRQAHRLLKPQKELSQPGSAGSLYERRKTEQAWALLEGGLKARYGVLKGGGILRTVRIFMSTLPNQEEAVKDIILRMHFDPELAGHLLGRNVKVDTPLWNAKLNKLLAAATGARESVSPEDQGAHD
ncbi:hypothetical protein [Mesorhizobium sp. Root552]|uniref:hypothetical protein n=1 Tax=Mesorhizobium sp. Root552 TaxID=1736555 RepID=UPI000AB973EB|nr:hypothetical protein [Mesorhizobium sp. Root552]